MIPTQKISLFLSAILLLSGCAHYEIQVNGSMGTSAPIIKPEATIAVVYDTKAPNLVLEKEVRAKIERLLTAKGYKVGTVQNSDYYLLFWYGIGPEGTTGSSRPSPQSQSPAANKPDSGTDYSRWLQLKLIDGKRSGETNESRYAWVGEATSSGPNPDLKEVIDYLLISAFDHFCENTGKNLAVTITDGDARIKKLMESH